MTSPSKIELWKLTGLQEPPSIEILYDSIMNFLNLYTIRPLTIWCFCWCHMTMTSLMLKTYINSVLDCYGFADSIRHSTYSFAQQRNALGYIDDALYSLQDSTGYRSHLEEPICGRLSIKEKLYQWKEEIALGYQIRSPQLSVKWKIKWI